MCFLQKLQVYISFQCTQKLQKVETKEGKYSNQKFPQMNLSHFWEVINGTNFLKRHLI